MNNCEYVSGPTEYPKAWQTKIGKKFKIPFPFAWVIFGLAIFVFGFAFREMQNKFELNILKIILQSALIATIANSVVYYEKLINNISVSAQYLLDENDKTIHKWLKKWHGNIFNARGNMSMSIALSLICMYCAAETIGSGHTLAYKLFEYLISAIIGYLGGSMFWAMLGIAGMISTLGRSVNIIASIDDTSTLSIVSSLIWKVSITATAAYLLGISTYVVLDIEMSNAGYITTVMFGIFIVLYFIVPQVNIHGTLMELKRKKLRELVAAIDKTFDQVAATPTPENINQLRDMFDLQRTLSGRRSWAFGLKELILLLGTVLVPLVVVVVDKLING